MRCPKPGCNGRLEDSVRGEHKLIQCTSPLCGYAKTIVDGIEEVHDLAAPSMTATIKSVVKAIASKVMARIG